jgi:hypothetical protein
VELQAKDPAAQPEALVGQIAVDAGARSGRQLERVAVPVQDGASSGRPDSVVVSVEVEGTEPADLKRRARPVLRSGGRASAACASSCAPRRDAEHRGIRRDSCKSSTSSRRGYGAIALADPHRPAHDDEQIPACQSAGPSPRCSAGLDLYVRRDQRATRRTFELGVLQNDGALHD